jgi:hypothetical protein
MKKKYITVLVVLSILFLTYIYSMLCTTLGADPRHATIIQGTSIFVALIAVVVAWAASDRKERSVIIKVQLNPDAEGARCYQKRSIIDAHLREEFADYGDVIRSHKVRFTLVNESGFDLPNPIFTFRLPADRQHPHWETVSTEMRIKTRTFYSNLFSSPNPRHSREFGKTCVLANKVLPVLNDGDEISIWIKMILEDPREDPFEVTIYVNCENAKGFNKTITINPKKLLESIRKTAADEYRDLDSTQ